MQACSLSSVQFVIPTGLLRRSKALGYEGWKVGIQYEIGFI